MGSCAGRGREAKEAAAVARTASLTTIAVNGGLKLTRGAEALPLALIRVQVFHVPEEGGTKQAETNTSGPKEYIHMICICLSVKNMQYLMLNSEIMPFLNVSRDLKFRTKLL